MSAAAAPTSGAAMKLIQNEACQCSHISATVYAPMP
jgi:hypothetical protein